MEEERGGGDGGGGSGEEESGGGGGGVWVRVVRVLRGGEWGGGWGWRDWRVRRKMRARNILRGVSGSVLLSVPCECEIRM